jgi:hypothetical protein
VPHPLLDKAQHCPLLISFVAFIKAHYTVVF